MQDSNWNLFVINPKGMFSLKQRVVSSSYVLSCLPYTPLNYQRLEPAFRVVCQSLPGLIENFSARAWSKEHSSTRQLLILPMWVAYYLHSLTKFSCVKRRVRLSDSARSAAEGKATSRRWRKHSSASRYHFPQRPQAAG